MLPEEAILHDRAGLLGRGAPGPAPLVGLPADRADADRRPRPAGPGLRLRSATARLMRRPVHVAVLVSTVRAALRDRERQYARRDDLAEREENLGRWRLALEAGGLASWDLDPQTGRLAWSGRAGDLFGDRPRAAPRGRSGPCSSWSTDDDRIAVAEGIARGHRRGRRARRPSSGSSCPAASSAGSTPGAGPSPAATAGPSASSGSASTSPTAAATRRPSARNDRRKDEFLAMLAHELRNPLAAITNAVQVARRPGDTRPRRLGDRRRSTDQVRHLSRLIDDLLDVSRITRGDRRAPPPSGSTSPRSSARRSRPAGP